MMNKELKTKLSKILIAPYRKSYGFSLKRIRRDKRCCMRYMYYKRWFVMYKENTHTILRAKYPNGVVVVLENNDYFVCESGIKKCIGSDDIVSAFWYISDRNVYNLNKDLLERLKPVKKHIQTNVGNKAWSGDYIVYIKGGNQKSIVIPYCETERQIGNLEIDYCDEVELKRISMYFSTLKKTRCLICNQHIEQLDENVEICHKKSVSSGGKFRLNNLFAGHKECNSILGDRSLVDINEDFLIRLKNIYITLNKQ